MTGFFDGSCGPTNPGGTGKYGWALLDDDTVLEAGRGVVGKGPAMTNNVAEYHALIRLLEFIRDKGIQDEIDEVLGDSKLVVGMSGREWNGKEPHRAAPHLTPLCLKASRLLSKLGLRIGWIPREQNYVADVLSKL